MDLGSAAADQDDGMQSGGPLMTVESLAAWGLLLAAMCLAFHLRRGRSKGGQAFSCQLGDQVFTGRYDLSHGVVRVTCERGSRSAPVGNSPPLRVAERLLAEMHPEAGLR